MSLLSVGITAGGTMLEAVMVVAADKPPRLPPSSKPAAELRLQAVTTADVWASLWPTRLRRAALLFSSPKERRSRDAEWISLTNLGSKSTYFRKAGDHSAGPVWTGASGVITWLAVSVRFFSDSVWTIAGLNVATTAARCKSPNSGRGNSRTYFKSSIRHWP